MIEKNDPLAFGAAVLAAIGSPVFGEYAPIVVGAIFGGFVSVSKLESSTRLQALVHLMRTTLVAIGLTGAIAWTINKMSGLDARQAGFFVAFAIGWAGEGQMATVRDRLIEFAFGWLSKRS